jgi:uncharacterized membrane protein
MVDEPATPSVTGQADPPTAGSESVVVASFKSRRNAERMVASLGHFRRQALKGSASAFVVTRNGDGSFRLVQSRVVTTTGILANVSKFAAIVMAGLIAIGPAIEG